MSAMWETVPAQPAPGDETPIYIVDQEDGIEGRTVCIIPGNLQRRVTAKVFHRLLDEQDVANGMLIALAPQMHASISALVKWSTQSRKTTAPCWIEARALLARLRAVQ